MCEHFLFVNTEQCEHYIDVLRSFYGQNEISLNHNNFNVHTFYHSIYCIVSSIKTYDMLMA